ncbi:ABC transporter ATP-binding protein [Roseovarius sp. MMSF_3350]|uniref:ABC transporter ATP-binding protein n=1 Tax=Roseovarius sp. MMSF_3350 TaxID=3046706 RepID=UPI00273D9007|nr:ABC transporter ATP-binding protein [Roseovarius sp. MMSF_3350]
MTTDTNSAVRLDNVSKTYGTVQVIKDLSLSIEKGEFVSLLGPSGCGKTTLLRMIAGLEDVTSGTVLIGKTDATNLPPEMRDISMVFQSYALLPHLTVRENVMFPLRMRRLGTKREQVLRAEGTLDLVQLRHLADRKPAELSGGQQQRVAIARAVVSQPQVLLLDEPLSNLDAKLRENMQEELIRLHRQTGLTTVFVTHDPKEALSLSDRIVLLNGGNIEQVGSPKEIYAEPRTRFAATFMGAGNLIDAVFENRGTSCSAIVGDQRIPLGRRDLSDGAKVTLMLRQEAIQIHDNPGDGDLRAQVRTRIYLGGRSRYVLDVGGQELRCLADAAKDWAQGQDLGLSVEPEAVHVVSDGTVALIN